MRGTTGYLPALDGVRALAIGLVLLAHAFGGVVRGGVIGVDLFFVLSGFLITGILVDEVQRTGSLNLRAFYARRALRLFPALAALLLLVAVLPWPFPPDETATKWVAIAATAGYVANYVGDDLANLSHAWSLAVEEQFYLLWPLTLLWLLRRTSPAVRVAAMIVGFAIFRAIGWATGALGPGWLVTRADQLLIGALLALLVRRGFRVKTAWGWVGLLGLAVVFAARIFTGDREMMLGGLTVTALAAALLIGHLASGDESALHRVATWQPLVTIGMVSYGIYLYHRPIFRQVNHAFITHGWLGPTYSVARLAIEAVLTAAAVWLSWRFIEKPALRLKDRVAPRSRQAACSAPTVTAGSTPS
jgi:peptidoglycan/LPS O-acetylase OafA/YrhL